MIETTINPEVYWRQRIERGMGSEGPDMQTVEDCVDDFVAYNKSIIDGIVASLDSLNAYHTEERNACLPTEEYTRYAENAHRAAAYEKAIEVVRKVVSNGIGSDPA
jgi:hypothetical protein